MEKMFSYIQILPLHQKFWKEWLHGEEMNEVLFCILMTYAEPYELCSISTNPNSIQHEKIRNQDFRLNIGQLIMTLHTF